MLLYKIEVDEVQNDAKDNQQKCLLAKGGRENATHPAVTKDIDTDLQLIAESLQKACRSMRDSGMEQREIIAIIKKMAAIAQEIGLLSDHPVPTMRKL
ncbi:hypothetical protein SPTER_28080 [Sporomusa termitida]|uniref:Uncharacterized protein n=2 Tax=Sporomusa termitida TaxID=2377 RepID=A0A517DVQ8_9FIRM|nr:hypothetical protein SPTER_28080 [Sporomusa termitida]